MQKIALITTLIAVANPALAFEEASWAKIGSMNMINLLDQGAKLVSVTVQNEPVGNRNTFLYMQLDKKLYRCWINEPFADPNKAILLGCGELVRK